MKISLLLISIIQEKLDNQLNKSKFNIPINKNEKLLEIEWEFDFLKQDIQNINKIYDWLLEDTT